jgi:hypothetical protein
MMTRVFGWLRGLDLDQQPSAPPDKIGPKKMSARGVRARSQTQVLFGEIGSGARYVPKLDALCIPFRSELLHCAASAAPFATVPPLPFGANATLIRSVGFDVVTLQGSGADENFDQRLRRQAHAAQHILIARVVAQGLEAPMRHFDVSELRVMLLVSLFQPDESLV